MILGIVLVFLGLIIIYWNIDLSPFKSSFYKDIYGRMEKVADNNTLCTEEEINKLPKPFRRYCEYVGLEGSKKYNVVNVEFYNTDFVFDSSTGKILKMDYDLWLFSDKPFRSAYCTSSIIGIPFDGIDYWTDNKEGGMKGILGKTVTLFDDHNEQMYIAGLISWLAEGVAVNPSIILSPYINYREIDETHVEATVTYNGISGTGVFTFSEDGQLLYFESDQRQVEKIGGVMTTIGWRAEYEEYTEKNGIRIPSVMRAIKVFPDREVIYFNSDDAAITYYH